MLSHHSPAVLDVLVDDPGDSHGEESVVPAAHEHDCEAHHHSEQGKGPGEEEENKKLMTAITEAIEKTNGLGD